MVKKLFIIVLLVGGFFFVNPQQGKALRIEGGSSLRLNLTTSNAAVYDVMAVKTQARLNASPVKLDVFSHKRVYIYVPDNADLTRKDIINKIVEDAFSVVRITISDHFRSRYGNRLIPKNQMPETPNVEVLIRLKKNEMLYNEASYRSEVRIFYKTHFWCGDKKRLTWGNEIEYENNFIENKKNEGKRRVEWAKEQEMRKKEEEAKRKKADADKRRKEEGENNVRHLCAKYKIDYFTKLENLHQNPFQYEGKVIGVVTSLKIMLSRTSGVFGGGNNMVLITGFPQKFDFKKATSKFDQLLLLGVEVKGRQKVLIPNEGRKILPHLKFVEAALLNGREVVRFHEENQYR